MLMGSAGFFDNTTQLLQFYDDNHPVTDGILPAILNVLYATNSDINRLANNSIGNPGKIPNSDTMAIPDVVLSGEKRDTVYKLSEADKANIAEKLASWTQLDTNLKKPPLTEGAQNATDDMFGVINSLRNIYEQIKAIAEIHLEEPVDNVHNKVTTDFDAIRKNIRIRNISKRLK